MELYGVHVQFLPYLLSNVEHQSDSQSASLLFVIWTHLTLGETDAEGWDRDHLNKSKPEEYVDVFLPPLKQQGHPT